MKIYERNINSSVEQLSEDTILTKASLLDVNHSMEVAIEINLKSRTITNASAVILKAPLPACSTTIDLAKKLVGLKIERGINKGLVEALGGAGGCTHLYELGLNAVRLSYNVMVGKKFNWNEWLTRTLPEDKFVKTAMPYLKNACRPFKEEK